MNYAYLFSAFLLIVLLVVVPMIVKRVTYKKLMEELNQRDFAACEKTLDSFAVKMSFSAFEREAMRLSLYEAQADFNACDKQLALMENMRLSRKQKASLGERGFYIYLAQGKVKKAAKMMELVKSYGTPQQLENLEIQYSILLKKEAKYLQEVELRWSHLHDDNGLIKPGLEMNAGTYEYLIGLQYSYLKDQQNMEKWMERALSHLKGTPYEPDIHKMLGR